MAIIKNTALEENFQDAKNTIFTARLLYQFECNRGAKGVSELIGSVARELGMSEHIPLVNQASSLMVAHSSLGTLSEGMRKDFEPALARVAKEFLRKNNSSVSIKYGPKAKCFTDVGNEHLFLRRIRNSLAHGRYQITSEDIIFEDKNFRQEEDFVKIQMPWALVGMLSEKVFYTCSDCLYQDEKSTGISGAQ